MPLLLLNVGPQFKFDETVLVQVATTSRKPSIVGGNRHGGGTESMCGSCKDHCGLSGQISPKRLTELMT